MTRHASHRVSRSLLLSAFAVAAWAVAPSGATGQQPGTLASSLQAIEVNGTTLHYVMRGSGEPVVFTHLGAPTVHSPWRQGSITMCRA